MLFVKFNAIELLLPQHFAPFHKFLRFFVQNQRFHACQKVFRSKTALSERNQSKVTWISIRRPTLILGTKFVSCKNFFSKMDCAPLWPTWLVHALQRQNSRHWKNSAGTQTSGWITTRAETPLRGRKSNQNSNNNATFGFQLHLSFSIK